MNFFPSLHILLLLPILLHFAFMFTCYHVLDSEMQRTKLWNLEIWQFPAMKGPFHLALPKQVINKKHRRKKQK